MNEIMGGIGPGGMSLILGLLFSICYASLFHIWIGRSERDLILFLLTAAVGFGIGHLLGTILQINLWRIGQLYMLEGSIGAWLAMIGVQLFYSNR